MNNFTAIARLTGDPEIRYSNGQKQTCIATINVAIPRKFKQEGQPDADFFQCVCFGKMAENIEKYLTKGSKIAFTGEVQNNNYESNGVKHYGTKILISSWEFAESKKSEQAVADDNPFEEKPKATRQRKQAEAPKQEEIIDDVPFF